MRLWSLHPKDQDTKGLVALWRESLLAQKVLLDQTKGFKHHPQLIRFREHTAPTKVIGLYLMDIWEEVQRSGYRFNADKIQYQQRDLC